MIQISSQPGLFLSLERGSAESRDGTTIGYTIAGNGPGLVLVHGNVSSSDDWAPVAGLLRDSLTVYCMDRRGRGLSGPQGEGYSSEKEREDIEAVMKQTGSSFIFGHSYGALMAIEVARGPLDSGLKKLALYDPPLFAGELIHRLMPSFKEAMARSDYVQAYLALIAGLGVLHGFTEQQFRWYLENQVKPSPAWPRIVQLLEATENEAAEAARFPGHMEGLERFQTLLILGSDSPAFIQDSAQYILERLPSSKKVILQGQGHMAQAEAPELLAEVLRTFFTPGSAHEREVSSVGR
jgi:pimeloyl-ACP methyl ester carboxylesterase